MRFRAKGSFAEITPLIVSFSNYSVIGNVNTKRLPTPS